ncbi:ABC transporter permease [Candidatus Micrarchaeota archaeon]|nr:ABC transporter permease [Candidatus Micrarchaeota archaeon]
MASEERIRVTEKRPVLKGVGTMKLSELLKYTFESLRHRSLRSWLTILGIIIGIASIVILISLAQGLDASIKDQLGSLGSNYVLVTPGNFFEGGLQMGPPILKGILYDRDVERINNIGGVEATSGNIGLTLANVQFKEENVSSTVIGVNADAWNKFLIKGGYQEGKFFNDGDQTSAIVGKDVAHGLFSDDLRVGDTLYILGKPFKVRGIVKDSPQANNRIFIDQRAARGISNRINSGSVDSILVVTREGSNIEIIEQRIYHELRNSHKVREGEEDFSTLTAASISAQIGEITALLTLFLGGVAAISLLVGGIGVANAMFTSVLERTREIGILKALGASPHTILQLFLLESGMIGFAGGAIGVGLGVGTSLLMNAFDIPSVMTIELMGFALAFSFSVGVISGVVPARNASKLQPVEALRYE